MLRFDGTTLASIPALVTLVVGCAGRAGVACAVRLAACASALAAGSWVACVAQPHKMAARANTLFFMLLSPSVGRQRSIMAQIIFAQMCRMSPARYHSKVNKRSPATNSAQRRRMLEVLEQFRIIVKSIRR